MYRQVLTMIARVSFTFLESQYCFQTSCDLITKSFIPFSDNWYVNEIVISEQVIRTGTRIGINLFIVAFEILKKSGKNGGIELASNFLRMKSLSFSSSSFFSFFLFLFLFLFLSLSLSQLRSWSNSDWKINVINCQRQNMCRSFSLFSLSPKFSLPPSLFLPSSLSLFLPPSLSFSLTLRKFLPCFKSRSKLSPPLSFNIFRSLTNEQFHDCFVASCLSTFRPLERERKKQRKRKKVSERERERI